MKYNHTAEELNRLQNLSLEEKITLSKLRITEWYQHWQGKVCVSYSGGKDSTVLLNLVRELYPDVLAVYVDTRLDYPEVRKHVKATNNVITLKPEMSFREVINKYGFCFPGKEVAQAIEQAKNGSAKVLNYFAGKNGDGTENVIHYRNFAKWKFLIDIPVKISAKCCNVMKEKPLEKFQRENKLKPYVGLLATDSLRRRYAWYMTGCNAFSAGKSKPLSFWTEQDILRYIVKFNLKIPSAYGEIIFGKNGKLCTTREKRTGCIFCPIGAHLEKPNKFQRLRESHPNLYRYCMKELGLYTFLSAVGVAY